MRKGGGDDGGGRCRCRFPAATPLYDLLKLFETGRTHMVLLTEGSKQHEGQQAAAHGAAGGPPAAAAAGPGALQPTSSGPPEFLLFQESSEMLGVPVGIMTIEDVIEELMQVRRQAGGRRPPACPLASREASPAPW
jgi:metal transporter CNNM